MPLPLLQLPGRHSPAQSIAQVVDRLSVILGSRLGVYTLFGSNTEKVIFVYSTFSMTLHVSLSHVFLFLGSDMTHVLNLKFLFFFNCFGYSVPWFLLFFTWVYLK